MTKSFPLEKMNLYDSVIYLITYMKLKLKRNRINQYCDFHYELTYLRLLLSQETKLYHLIVVSQAIIPENLHTYEASLG